MYIYIDLKYHFISIYSLLYFVLFSRLRMGFMDEFDANSYPGGHMKMFKKKLAEVRASPPWMRPMMKTASEWNPYSFEGGSVSNILFNNDKM